MNRTDSSNGETVTITKDEYEDLLKAKHNLEYVLMLAESDRIQQKRPPETPGKER